MSNNFKYKGDKINFTAAADYSSGDLASLGNGFCGVIENDVDYSVDANAVACVKGVFEVPKDSSTLNVGVTTLYLVTASKAVSTATAGATAISNGRIWETAGSSATTVLLELR